MKKIENCLKEIINSALNTLNFYGFSYRDGKKHWVEAKPPLIISYKTDGFSIPDIVPLLPQFETIKSLSILKTQDNNKHLLIVYLENDKAAKEKYQAATEKLVMQLSDADKELATGRK